MLGPTEKDFPEDENISNFFFIPNKKYELVNKLIIYLHISWLMQMLIK